MKTKLPPIPPNLGIENYDWFTPLKEINDAVKRWQKGERPTDINPKHEAILRAQGREKELNP